ncbi:DsbA family oxidoreductase [Paenibacillus sacheonensis]|uniref:DsbA family oxidoreductase n=1 Tax=Paenibacillus sacheonensis TaxID=742054 RepID=A0A7X5C1S8_9BACL|nr:DsbA family oxidoreductase [Paenibacillus sacheonensis]MBM7566567.1 putative DsbA family dithiol-disulfide isomerase [Paenibacillus sacheonensis]NBC73067.1 DsbA family oxidoreductase [Paenibacillus sacheonensis]
MHIDLYSDIACPWCRIGKQNLARALQLWAEQNDEPVTVAYHAYQLDPELPEEGQAFDEAMIRKMGGADSMKRVVEHVTGAGAAVGLTFRFDRVGKMPNTRLAHRFVALLPEEKKEEAVEALFKSYFEDGGDVTQMTEILAVAEQIGVYAPDLQERLERGEGEDAVEAALRRGRQIGVQGVPFFVFNNRYALSGAYPAEELFGLMGGARV